MVEAVHPGSIKMVNVFEGSEEIVPIDMVPEAGHFVYLKDGVETSDPAEAMEAVPVVEVRMISMNDAGDLVAPQEASKIRMLEFGPNEYELRSTIMFPR